MNQLRISGQYWYDISHLSQVTPHSTTKQNKARCIVVFIRTTFSFSTWGKLKLACSLHSDKIMIFMEILHAFDCIFFRQLSLTEVNAQMFHLYYQLRMFVMSFRYHNCQQISCFSCESCGRKFNFALFAKYALTQLKKNCMKNKK